MQSLFFINKYEIIPENGSVYQRCAAATNPGMKGEFAVEKEKAVFMIYLQLIDK